jgi:hypothetical protein
MNTEQIRAKSKDTMMKELLGSIIAATILEQLTQDVKIVQSLKKQRAHNPQTESPPTPKLE